MTLFYNNTVLVVERQVPSFHHFRHMENRVGPPFPAMTKILESHKKDLKNCEGWNRAAHMMSEKWLYMSFDDRSGVDHPGSFQSSFIWLRDAACCCPWPHLKATLLPVGGRYFWWCPFAVLTLHDLDLVPTLMRVLWLYQCGLIRFGWA